MYEHQQYLRHVNLTGFTVRLKRKKELTPLWLWAWPTSACHDETVWCTN